MMTLHRQVTIATISLLADSVRGECVHLVFIVFYLSLSPAFALLSFFRSFCYHLFPLVLLPTGGWRCIAAGQIGTAYIL